MKKVKFIDMWEVGNLMLEYSSEAKEYNLALCEGRHEIKEANGSIFPQEVQIMDFAGLQKHAEETVRSIERDASKEGKKALINLYVTGATPCLIAVINACCEIGVSITCWHYNRDTQDYQKQVVLSICHEI